ncbi:GNAT family N-acetyltransferase [Pontibacillus salicampi]|uniref:GNAT family N-acetyltransferase n=1 Tax=Pontibacillus salicampi TaxID=1449801 RepID=A0ABV6LKP2_9BACI
MMFKGERIYLRKVTEEDGALYSKWVNDLEVMTLTRPHLEPYSEHEAKNFIRHIANDSSAKSFIIECHQTNNPIGITSLIHLDFPNRNAECIIDIGEKHYWSQGYGEEAMCLLLDYAFLEINLHKVYLKVFSYNERAIRLYNKLGFKVEGELQEHLFREGAWHNITMMAVFQDEYNGRIREMK